MTEGQLISSFWDRETFFEGSRLFREGFSDMYLDERHLIQVCEGVMTFCRKDLATPVRAPGFFRPDTQGWYHVYGSCEARYRFVKEGQ